MFDYMHVLCRIMLIKGILVYVNTCVLVSQNNHEPLLVEVRKLQMNFYKSSYLFRSNPTLHGQNKHSWHIFFIHS